MIIFKSEIVENGSMLFLSKNIIFISKNISINIQLRVSYLLVSCENTKIVYGVYCVKPYDNAKPINIFPFIYSPYIYIFYIIFFNFIFTLRVAFVLEFVFDSGNKHLHNLLF